MMTESFTETIRGNAESPYDYPPATAEYALSRIESATAREGAAVINDLPALTDHSRERQPPAPMVSGTIPPVETDGELGTMKLIWRNSDPETNIFARTELVALLVSEDPETRTDAMRRLDIAGEDELLPFLSGCLTHSYDKLRSAAARVLKDMGDDSVLFSFIDDFGSSDSGERFDAERAILAFDDPGPLVRHMQHFMRNKGEERRGERIDAIEALGELGDERAVPFLIDALYDGERNVRSEAANVLGMLGSERAVPALLGRLTGDWAERVQLSAGLALGDIGGEEALEGLMQKLPRLSLAAWIAAVEALGQIGDRRAIPHLLRSLLRYGNMDIRTADLTLKKLDDGSLFTRLIDDLENGDDKERQCAALGLSLMGDSRATGPLAHALKDSHIFVAAAAAYSLGELGGDRALQALIEALAHDNQYVRSSVVKSLDRMGDTRAIEALEKLIEDAQGALDRLRRQEPTNLP